MRKSALHLWAAEFEAYDTLLAIIRGQVGLAPGDDLFAHLDGVLELGLGCRHFEHQAEPCEDKAVPYRFVRMERGDHLAGERCLHIARELVHLAQHVPVRSRGAGLLPLHNRVVARLSLCIPAHAVEAVVEPLEVGVGADVGPAHDALYAGVAFESHARTSDGWMAARPSMVVGMAMGLVSLSVDACGCNCNGRDGVIRREKRFFRCGGVPGWL